MGRISYRKEVRMSQWNNFLICSRSGSSRTNLANSL
jgi:hypothetical protein